MSAMPQHQHGFDLEATLTVIVNDLGQIKGRLTSIDARLEGVDARLDSIEADMVYVKAGVNALIDSVAGLSERVDRLEGP